jgi:2-polyprenyl-3-methyl-5-hydroxy-6-metoxy-1,4-benzoquinol methylase
MNEAVVEQLLAVNEAFYRQFARSFAETRRQPQPGFYRLLEILPRPCHRFLDVGCGDGRLGRFLLDQSVIEDYSGVDFSAELLALAGQYEDPRVTFYQRDLSQAGCLAGLGPFNAVVCLSMLQHVPGRANRLRLLREMGQHLVPDGMVILANWQFLNSPRQRRKIADWEEIGLSVADVEPHDYLLTWQRDGYGLRYVCLIDEVETRSLSQAAGLSIADQFYSDGREGNLNLYTILQIGAV